MISQDFIRKASIFLLMLSFLMGIGLYQLKNRVSATALELNHVKSKIHNTQDNLHTLKAEWGFLKSPKRLARLNQKYLHLKPYKAIQVASLRTMGYKARHKIMVAYRKGK